MEILNIFSKKISDNVVERLHLISATQKPLWGKMDAAQMLAHVNVQYEMTYDNIHKPMPGFVRFILKTFVKKGVVNDQPYKQNSGTAPQW